MEFLFCFFFFFCFFFSFNKLVRWSDPDERNRRESLGVQGSGLGGVVLGRAADRHVVGLGPDVERVDLGPVADLLVAEPDPARDRRQQRPVGEDLLLLLVMMMLRTDVVVLLLKGSELADELVVLLGLG
jgi:hypothetical protein